MPLYSSHPTINTSPATKERDKVINGAASSKDWQMQDGSWEELKDHCTSGGAIICCHMTDHRRSSSVFGLSDCIAVDVDNGLRLDQLLDHPLGKYIALCHTTCSHSAELHKFRLMFQLPCIIVKGQLYSEVSTLLIKAFGSDKACRDCCRFYYGNSEAEVSIFNPEAPPLPQKLIEEAQANLLVKEHSFDVTDREVSPEDIARAEYCLEHFIEPTTDTPEGLSQQGISYRNDKFVPITMAARSVGDDLFHAWQRWAESCYHGKQNNQASARFFGGCRSAKHKLGTIFYHADLDHPGWRDELPEELRSKRYESDIEAMFPEVVGYAMEDFMGIDDDGIDLSIPEEVSEAIATQDLFASDTTRECAPRTVKQIEKGEAAKAPAHIDVPYGKPGSRASVVQTYALIQRYMPGLRHNMTTGFYEFGSSKSKNRFDDENIDQAYIKLSFLTQQTLVKQTVKDCILDLARSNPYYPVRDYFTYCYSTCTPCDYWDKLAEELLGVRTGKANPMWNENTSIATLILQRFFIGLIARSFQPGCVMDWMLILVGDQAVGKSSFFKLLLPMDDATKDHQWTTTVQSSLHSVQAKPHKLHCGAIVVFDEVERMFSRKMTEEFKNVVSVSVDYSDKKYQNEKRLPRSFVLAGAANNSGLFTDPTGNRRFMPIRVMGKPAKPVSTRQIDLDKLRRDRNCIWAKAYQEYEKGTPFVFTSEEISKLKKYQSNFDVDDAFHHSVIASMKAMEQKYFTPSSHKREGIKVRCWRTRDVLAHMQIPIDRYLSVQKSVTDTFVFLEMRAEKHNFTNDQGYQQERVWYRPADLEQETL